MVSKPGPGELHPLPSCLSLPIVFVVCCSSPPSCESLALSINSLLSCFTFHLIQQQAAGPPAYGIETACLETGVLFEAWALIEKVLHYSGLSFCFRPDEKQSSLWYLPNKCSLVKMNLKANTTFMKIHAWRRTCRSKRCLQENWIIKVKLRLCRRSPSFLHLLLLTHLSNFGQKELHLLATSYFKETGWGEDWRCFWALWLLWHSGRSLLVCAEVERL